MRPGYGLALAASLLAVVPLAAQAPAARPSGAGGAPLRRPTLYEDLQMFSQVLNQIRVNHLDSVDTHALIMAAVEGMVHAADPYSYVISVARLSPEKARALEEGKLVPIPVSFRFTAGAPRVASIAPTSTAARSDILAGDELIAIDGQPVTALSAEELEITLAGPKNSEVRLRLARQRSDGSTLEVERTVKREWAEEASAVAVSRMLDRETGYIQITTFANEDVAGHLNGAIGRLKSAGMRRLVLDLRDNGGGYVDQAAKVAGVFLPAGAVVYTSVERKGVKPDTARVKRSFWKKEERYPVIVLVNDGTASASELVAGALQDHDRALVVGRPTEGKSLIMRGFPLLDGSVIFMAFGRVMTPCGRVVQRDYRGISRREYRRLASAARDTAGRPTCRTSSGRIVHGGGGIYPDVQLPERQGPPTWMARLLENDLPLQWAGGYLSSAPLPSLDSLTAQPSLPSGALADFRKFAESKGAEVPALSGEEEARLERLLLGQLTYVKWGEGGFHQIAASLDPMVKDAVKHFDRAVEVLGKP